MRLRSSLRFPYCLKEYLNPKHYWRVARHYYERARYGYSYADLWAFDKHLASMLIRALPHFKNCNNPYVEFYLSEDYEHIVRGYRGEVPMTTAEERRVMRERWDEMIDEMIDGFQAAYSDFPDLVEADKKLQRSLHLLARYFPLLWD